MPLKIELQQPFEHRPPSLEHSQGCLDMQLHITFLAPQRNKRLNRLLEDSSCPP
jgi:hypothetical protein